MKTFTQLMEAIAGPIEEATEAKEKKTYRIPVEVSPPHGGISMVKNIHLDADNKTHARKLASKYVRDRGHKLHSIGKIELHEGVEPGDDLGESTRDTVTEIVVESVRPQIYRIRSGADGYINVDDTIHESELEEFGELGFDINVTNYEQLDELSKTTLSNYINKAVGSLERNSFKSGALHGEIGTGSSKEKMRNRYERNTSKRYYGINRATKKLVKEDDQITELSKTTLGNYINKAADQVDRKSWKSGYYGRGVDSADSEAARRLQKTSDKRLKGISKATKKLVKEDDQITELSKESLGRYIKSASVDKSFHATDVGHINGIAATVGTSKAERDEREKASNKHGRRSLGIQRAVDKLTK